MVAVVVVQEVLLALAVHRVEEPVASVRMLVEHRLKVSQVEHRLPTLAVVVVGAVVVLAHLVAPNLLAVMEALVL